MGNQEMIKHRRDLWKILVQGNAAEIGVAEGLFSGDMLEWPCNFPIVYMVDRWKHVSIKGDSAQPQSWHDANWLAAYNRTRKYGARAVILRGESVEMAKEVPDKSLSLVYIDADHSYAGVISDVRAWRSKLLSGGVMAFHDYENSAYGVKMAVQDSLSFMRLTNEIADFGLLPENSINDAGAWFRVK